MRGARAALQNAAFAYVASVAHARWSTSVRRSDLSGRMRRSANRRAAKGQARAAGQSALKALARKATTRLIPVAPPLMDRT